MVVSQSSNECYVCVVEKKEVFLIIEKLCLGLKIWAKTCCKGLFVNYEPLPPHTILYIAR